MDHELTENEVAWLFFIREITLGADPAPTLKGMQALRRATNSYFFRETQNH